MQALYTDLCPQTYDLPAWNRLKERGWILYHEEHTSLGLPPGETLVLDFLNHLFSQKAAQEDIQGPRDFFYEKMLTLLEGVQKEHTIMSQCLALSSFSLWPQMAKTSHLFFSNFVKIHFPALQPLLSGTWATTLFLTSLPLWVNPFYPEKALQDLDKKMTFFLDTFFPPTNQREKKETSFDFSGQS